MVNTGGYVLQKWKIECNNRSNSGKIADFIKTTSTNSPTGHSGPTVLAPDNTNAFMYIETSGSNNGDGVFCSWEMNRFT